MKEILDIIVGNTFLFVGVLLFLGATFLVLLKAIVKTVNNHKIPIYEEDEELTELENIEAEDVIEKPKVKSKIKKDVKEEIKKDKNSDKTDEKETADEELIDAEPNKKTEKIIDDDLEEEPLIIGEEPSREELEQIDDKEIENRIDEEHKKDIKEALEENDHEELKEILSEMKETKEVDPEEVVRNFEEEQEAQSIISYQELVDVVKNRDNEFIDELESKPLATVSDFIVDNSKSNDSDIEVLEILENLEKSKELEETSVEELLSISESDIEQLEPSIEEIEVLEPTINEYKSNEIKESLPEIPDDGRFKKTDVISPIFGKIDSTDKIDYPKVEKFKRDNKEKNIKETDIKSMIPKIELPTKKKNDSIEKEPEIMATEVLKSFSNMFENASEKIDQKETKKIEEESIEEIESLTATSSISKNEDFLKALKDFRNNL